MIYAFYTKIFVRNEFSGWIYIAKFNWVLLPEMGDCFRYFLSVRYFFEGLMLKLKLQYTLATWREEPILRKDIDTGKDWRQEEKGMTEDEMVGWHHWLNGHELRQTPGVGEGQGSLVCYSAWGHKESDMTWWLNSNKGNI